MGGADDMAGKAAAPEPNVPAPAEARRHRRAARGCTVCATTWSEWRAITPGIADRALGAASHADGGNLRSQTAIGKAGSEILSGSAVARANCWQQAMSSFLAGAHAGAGAAKFRRTRRERRLAGHARDLP